MSGKPKKPIDIQTWGYGAGVVLFVVSIAMFMLPPEGSVQTLTFQQAPHKWIAWVLLAAVFVGGVLVNAILQWRSNRR